MIELLESMRGIYAEEGVKVVMPTVSATQTKMATAVRLALSAAQNADKVVDDDGVRQFIFGITPMDETVRVGHA